ncbi:Sugar ABC transporter permease OS=Streptomyces microflavus OX=1919 GN=Smic_81670 PE=3 SV=1 [Streptomyces microflavus]
MLALVIGFAIPFVMALVLNELRHAKAFFRVVVYLPVMIPPVVSALLWKWFYDPARASPTRCSAFSTCRRRTGPTAPTPPSSPSSSSPPGPTWAAPSSSTSPRSRASPASSTRRPSCRLAARQRIRHVTIPQTRFIILMLMLLQVIATMQVFTEPFVITGGGPENSTVTVLYLIYKYAFLYNDFGGASALSVMLLLVLSAFSALYLRLTRTD